ncbi:MAG TPA: hypothetical protein VMZ30_03020 [Pyrinomonadaceae bacterium]|nr:hypothetical protein [Pyrinomonadaceae bacterium]
MKKQLYMVITIIALLTVAGLTNANAQGPSSVEVKANIPFAFSVGNKTMPAGEYTVRCTNPNSYVKVLLIRSSDKPESALVITQSVIGKLQDDARLVFYRYGDHYYFAQVWLPSDSIGMQAPKSRREKQMEHELAANSLAKKTIAILAQR